MATVAVLVAVLGGVWFARTGRWSAIWSAITGAASIG